MALALFSIYSCFVYMVGKKFQSSSLWYCRSSSFLNRVVHLASLCCSASELFRRYLWQIYRDRHAVFHTYMYIVFLITLCFPRFILCLVFKDFLSSSQHLYLSFLYITKIICTPFCFKFLELFNASNDLGSFYVSSNLFIFYYYFCVKYGPPNALTFFIVKVVVDSLEQH